VINPDYFKTSGNDLKPIIFQNNKFQNTPLKIFNEKNSPKINIMSAPATTEYNLLSLSTPEKVTIPLLEPFDTISKPIIQNIELGKKIVGNKNNKTNVNIKNVLDLDKNKLSLFKLSNLGHINQTEGLKSPKTYLNLKTKSAMQADKHLSQELLPMSRPEIIAKIKTLLEPTISSGAVTFSNNPISRPEMVSNQDQLDKNSVTLNAKATRGPTFPKRASVFSSATINNILELNRTNLIGIFGTEFDAAALIRLASGKVIKVRVGDQFEGWRVFAIDKDKIHLANGNKQETLRLPG
jgi:hypothetical protein